MKTAATSNSAEREKPRRRWFQFRLRTLLVVVALLGCGFGWLGIKLEDARKQRAAVAEIKKLGGSVFYDCDFDSEGHFVHDAVPAGPAWLRAILGDDCFRNVRNVFLDRPGGATAISDVELENLKSLAHLKVLNLSGTQVTDAGLEKLAHLTELETLDLSYTKVTDAGLENLHRLTQLTSLMLDATQVSDAGLAQLENFKKLDDLSLNETKITDNGLESVSRLTALKWLNLVNTQTTDAGLHYLAGLTHLESIQLNYTKVTALGVEKLQAALPGCGIER